MASSISQYEIPTTYKKQHYDTTFEITTTKTMAMPIPIVRKGEQYSIKNTAFDPTQNSPPSIWKMRLKKRVGEQSSLHK
jgi:hypothetical protein